CGHRKSGDFRPCIDTSGLRLDARLSGAPGTLCPPDWIYGKLRQSAPCNRPAGFVTSLPRARCAQHLQRRERRTAVPGHSPSSPRRSTVGGGPGMLQVGRYVFKRADNQREFEQIHRLNYRTFVGEIPQHADNGAGYLVDKFHTKNAYLIVLKGDRVVGMLSIHDQPPFSIAERLSDPSILTRDGTRPLEIRLLAVEPEAAGRGGAGTCPARSRKARTAAKSACCPAR